MSALAEALPPVQAPVQVRKPRKLMPSRFKQADQARNVWVSIPEEGTTYEDLFAPEYWSHISEKMRQGDLIEVRPEDGSYFALLYAVAVQRQAAAVIEIVKKDLSTDPVNMPLTESGVRVEWKGPVRKWAVIRTKDNQIVSDKHEVRLTADTAAAEYLRVISR
jgi:hypothetical protein